MDDCVDGDRDKDDNDGSNVVAVGDELSSFTLRRVRDDSIVDMVETCATRIYLYSN